MARSGVLGGQPGDHAPMRTLGKNLVAQSWTITVTSNTGDYRIDGRRYGAGRRRECGYGVSQQVGTNRNRSETMAQWAGGERREGFLRSDNRRQIHIRCLSLCDGQGGFPRREAGAAFNAPGGEPDEREHNFEIVPAGDGREASMRCTCLNPRRNEAWFYSCTSGYYRGDRAGRSHRCRTGECAQQEGAGVCEEGGFVYQWRSLFPPDKRNQQPGGGPGEQTVPQISYIESYLEWKGLERQEGCLGPEGSGCIRLGLCDQHHLKLLVLPWVMTAPDWFKKTPGYAPLTDMQTGVQVDSYRHGLRPRSSPTIIYTQLWPATTKTGSGSSSLVAPGPHLGRWDCRSMITRIRAAIPMRGPISKRMLDKYGALQAALMRCGGPISQARRRSCSRIEKYASQRVRWVDFISWIQESEIRNMVSYLKIIRRYFPNVWLDIPLGFGSDLARDGCDRTAICRAAADFQPVTIRSTHGSFNRARTPLAYRFYKRMAPVCHRLGIGLERSHQAVI